MPRSRIAAAFLMIAGLGLAAQPQASSREELDSFGLAFEASDPLTRIRNCENFLARYPHSEFREKALELEFDAFEQRGDRAAMERIGARILARDRRNARILSDLAAAELPVDPALAGTHASQALAALQDLRRPEDMSRTAWIAWKKNILSSANATLGLRALREQKYAEAVAHLNEAVSIRPDSAEWQHDLGLALLETKQLEPAAAAFRRAHEIKPELRGTLVFLGIAELRLGNFANAANHLEQAITLEPRQREAWLNLLRADEALGKFDEPLVRRAAILFPDDGEIRFAIAQSALEQIREIARRVNELGPESLEFRSLVARKRGLPTAGNAPEIIVQYDRLATLVSAGFEAVLQISPNSSAAHIAKGYLEESQNNIEAALSDYRAGGDHFAAGRLLAQNSRLPEAESEFRAELETNPSNHLAMADLAEIYTRQNEIDKARPLLQALLKMYPQDAFAWLDLGKVQQQEEDWQGSARSFEKALAIDATLDQAHYRLSISYRRSGQTARAAAELEAFRKTRKN